MSNHDVVIVGAGMAGLAAARRLREKGHEPLVLESADRAGGRVHTDEVDGFRLDLGFQVLLTAYPEAGRVLDYDALDLRRFESGAVVRTEGGFHRVSDPFRNPGDLVSTLRAPVGSLADKLRTLRLRRRTKAGAVDDVFARAETSTGELIRSAGFSDRYVDRFLGPLFAGIALDRDLSFSSHVFEFVFRMLSEGDAAVPANGMGQIAEQLVSGLPDGTVRYRSAVEAVGSDHVVVDGEKIRARAVVLATALPEAAGLSSEVTDRGSSAMATWWMTAEQPPVRRPVLVLSGEGGPVNHLAVLSQVSEHYAPADRALVAVTTLDLDASESALRAQLRDWFGADAAEWETIRVDRIRAAQPTQPVGLDPDQPVRLDSGLFIAGDHRQNPSIDGALVSGRRAGDAVAARLCREP